LHEDKNVELGVVAFADAVVNPGTVVIVSVDAAATQVTMATTRGTNNFAVRAKTASFVSVEKLDEVDLRVTFESAWIREPHNDPKEHSETEKPLATIQKPIRLVTDA